MTWAPLWKEGPIKTLKRKLERRRLKRRAKRLRTLDQMQAWLLIRECIYDRDKGRCRVCGLFVYLRHVNPLIVGHVHHIVYRSACGPDESWNLILLCPECHSLEHDTKTLELNGNADICVYATLKHPKTYAILHVEPSPCP